jgi:hypothetical protein
MQAMLIRSVGLSLMAFTSSITGTVVPLLIGLHSRVDRVWKLERAQRSVVDHDEPRTSALVLLQPGRRAPLGRLQLAISAVYRSKTNCKRQTHFDQLGMPPEINRSVRVQARRPEFGRGLEQPPAVCRIPHGVNRPETNGAGFIPDSFCFCPMA